MYDLQNPIHSFARIAVARINFISLLCCKFIIETSRIHFWCMKLQSTLTMMIICFLAVILLLAACKKHNEPGAWTQDSSVLNQKYLFDFLNSETGKYDYLKTRQLFDSLLNYEDAGITDKVCRTKTELAEMFRRSGNYEEGLSFLFDALRLASSIRRPDLTVKIYDRLSAIHFERYYHKICSRSLDSSMLYATKALALADTVNDDETRVSALILIGAVYYVLENYIVAEDTLLSALAIYERLGQKPDQALITNLASTWLMLCKTGKALTLAEQFYEDASKLNDDYTNLMSLTLLAKVYDATGDITKAREVESKLDSFEKRQDILIERLAIKQLELSYQYGKLSMKTDEIDQHRGFLIRLNLVLAIILIDLIVVSMIIYYVVRQRNRNIRLKNELLIARQQADQLSMQNKEMQLGILEQEAMALQQNLLLKDSHLAAKMLIISRNNEFLIGILERVRKLNNEVRNSSARNSILEITGLIKKMVQEKNWDEFETLYASGNSTFVKNLNIKHPDLTAFEKRLCYLLHMNLSTKEISDITMQSCRAVEMARFRLRIKFHLEREANLTSYLSGFSHIIGNGKKNEQGTN